MKMKKVILASLVLMFFSGALFACSGDCISCHPALLKNNKLDNDHIILAKCIECHKITDNDLEKMGSLCGQDCWDCHSIQKTQQVVNPSHAALNSCIECHKKLNKNPFGQLVFSEIENSKSNYIMKETNQ